MSLIVPSFIIACAICYGIGQILRWHLRRRRLYESASKFAGPSLLPFIGNAHLFAGSSEHVVRKLNDLNTSYPSPFRLWLGPHLFIFVADPEQVKVICHSPKTLGKGDVAKIAHPLVGTGLFTAPVAKWQVHRKLIQPTFNQKILDSFVEVFSTQSKILIDCMEPNLDGPEFEIFHLVSSCSLDMICETAMGVRVGAQTEGNCDYGEALEGVMVTLFKRFLQPWLHPDFIFQRTKLAKSQEKHIKFLHEFTDNVIRMKRNELLNRKGLSSARAADDEDHSCESPPRREAFLDHLMKLSDHSNVELLDEALRDEVTTIASNGIGTPALTVSWVILMLVSFPEVQEKVYEELYEIYGDYDIGEHPVTPKDLARMKYLERVIKETLRLFPVAPLFIRAVEDDLDIGDHTLPRGSSAIVGILALHRNEKYWPDPLKFNPDRFLPEEIAKRHSHAFLAFSAGPRNCIGFNYATMAMKTIIATILRKYILKKDNILPIKDIQLKIEMVLKPVDPITIRIQRRPRNEK